jgi:hypothetical protein
VSMYVKEISSEMVNQSWSINVNHSHPTPYTNHPGSRHNLQYLLNLKAAAGLEEFLFNLIKKYRSWLILIYILDLLFVLWNPNHPNKIHPSSVSIFSTCRQSLRKNGIASLPRSRKSRSLVSPKRFAVSKATAATRRLSN